MKTYDQFLNEIASFYSDNSNIESYTFNIDMRFISNDSIIKDKIINELKLNTTVNDIRSSTINKYCYAWKIEVKNYNKQLFIDLDPITKYNDNLVYDITPDKFLKIGLKNVKVYLETKNDTDKYNL